MAAHTRGKGSQAPQGPRSLRKPRCTAPRSAPRRTQSHNPPGAPQEGAIEKDKSASQGAKTNRDHKSRVQCGDHHPRQREPSSPRPTQPTQAKVHCPPQCTHAYAKPQPPRGPTRRRQRRGHKRHTWREKKPRPQSACPMRRPTPGGEGSQAPQGPRSLRKPWCTAPRSAHGRTQSHNPPGAPQGAKEKEHRGRSRIGSR